MRVGISGTALLARGSVSSIVDAAREAHRDGFASFWLGEHVSGGIDAMTALTIAAQSVEDIELGSAVVPTYPRHPMVLAAQVLTASSVFGARFTLGVGLSHESMLNQLGLSLDRPVRHLKEYLSILLPLLGQGEVDFDGQMLSCHARTFVRPPARVGVVVAALGPQMLEIAGAMTDGTILSWVGPRTVERHIKPCLELGAASVGRMLPRIIATVPVCVTDDATSVRRAVSRRVSLYGELPSYRAVLEREGVRDPGDLCVIGSETEVRDQIGAYARAGVTDLAALELHTDSESPERTRELLKEICRTGC